MNKILLFPILIYRYCISPFFPKSCRFEPTCSQYAYDAIKKHGFHGLYLSMKRILKCNPLTKSVYDPVPEKKLKKNNIK